MPLSARALMERLFYGPENLPLQQSIDRDVAMQMHPLFKEVYFVAHDSSEPCKFLVRTFEESDYRGTLYTFEKIEEVFDYLMTPSVQHGLSGREFQITVVNGSKQILGSFPRWTMDTK